MQLKFTHNNIILDIEEVSSLELKQLKIVSTGESFNFIKKEKFTQCFLHNNRYLPAGFWKTVLDLKKKNYDVNITNIKDFVYDINQEDFMEWCENQPIKFQPRWYQAKGVYYALKYRISRGQFATSAGKSFILYLVSRYSIQHLCDDGQKVLIVVPSKMLVTQMEGDFYDYQLDDLLTVDKVSGGIKRTPNSNVVVSNIDSLINMPLDFFEQFDVVLLDEAHKLKTKTYQTIIKYLYNYGKLKLVYAVSGTFYPVGTLEELTAESYAGPVLMNVGAKELMDEDSVTPLEIKMFYIRYPEDICYNYYHMEELDVLNKRNHLEMEYVRLLKSRFDIITRVSKKITGTQLMLFKSVEYCKIFEQKLIEMCPEKEVYRITGDVDSKHREFIKERSENNDNVIICATYATMSTGVSIKRLTYLHLVESAKSFIMIRQSIGRTLRLHPDKSTAIVLDWVDVFKKYDKEWPGPHSNIFHRQAKEREKIYKEQQFEYTIKHINL